MTTKELVETGWTKDNLITFNKMDTLLEEIYNSIVGNGVTVDVDKTREMTAQGLYELEHYIYPKRKEAAGIPTGMELEGEFSSKEEFRTCLYTPMDLFCLRDWMLANEKEIANALKTYEEDSVDRSDS